MNEENELKNEAVEQEAPAPVAETPQPAPVVEPSPDASLAATIEVDRPNVETTSEAPVDVAPEAGTAESANAKGEKGGGKKKPRKVKGKKELERLAEFAIKFPEIGTTVAELAYKIGAKDIGDRVTKMGFDSDDRKLEFYAVAANVARNRKDTAEALRLINEALTKVTPDIAGEEKGALIRIVRLGYAVALFDLKDLSAAPEFTKAVGEKLPTLKTVYENDASFAALLAQSQWTIDKTAAEALWESAVAGPDAETAWNARGTWVKEAEKDLGRAVEIYKNGLEANPESSLLAHNLAQVKLDLYETAENKDTGALGQIDKLLKSSLRNCKRRGYRRHIHETMDRLQSLRTSTPKEPAPMPKVGDTVKGRVRSLQKYGAFLDLRGGYSGLLHISEIAHERISEPGQILKKGDTVEVKVIEVSKQDDGSFRIGFSRKAVLPAPAGGTANQKPKKTNNKPKGDRKPRNNKGGSKGKGPKTHKDNANFSLGEMLMAKLEEKDEKK